MRQTRSSHGCHQENAGDERDAIFHFISFGIYVLNRLVKTFRMINPTFLKIKILR